MHLPTFTHAGGIVLRRDGDAVRVLAVRPSAPPPASDPQDVWVLPKGHIESGEEPLDAALREVREESGVVGSDPAYLGYAAYRARGRDVVCAFYAMSAESEGEADEARDKAWLTAPELRAAMPYPDTVRLVDLAIAAVD
ncbi:MAG: NUDIX domain-containing protein [Planctomycetota bacterium]